MLDQTAKVVSRVVLKICHDLLKTECTNSQDQSRVCGQGVSRWELPFPTRCQRGSVAGVHFFQKCAPGASFLHAPIGLNYLLPLLMKRYFHDSVNLLGVPKCGFLSPTNLAGQELKEQLGPRMSGPSLAR